MFGKLFTTVSVFYVDSHSVPNFMEQWYISIIDEQTWIQAVEDYPDSRELNILTLWPHQ